MKQITAFQYLKDTLNYFFSSRKYINKYYIIKGKKRKIIAETCYNVLFEGLKESTPKAYLKTIQQPKINFYKQTRQKSHASPLSPSSQILTNASN